MMYLAHRQEQFEYSIYNMRRKGFMIGSMVVAVEDLSVDDFLEGKFLDITAESKSKKKQKSFADSSGTALS